MEEEAGGSTEYAHYTEKNNDLPVGEISVLDRVGSGGFKRCPPISSPRGKGIARGVETLLSRGKRYQEIRRRRDSSAHSIYIGLSPHIIKRKLSMKIVGRETRGHFGR